MKVAKYSENCRRFVLAVIVLMAAMRYPAQAQTLTLDQALARALDKNHAVVIAKNTAEAAANMATPGNAGLLPTVTANAGLTKASNNTDIEFANNIPAVSARGAETLTKTANVQFQYILRDGLGNVYRLNQLKAQSKQAELQAQQAIENTLVQVVGAYLGLVSAYDALDIAREQEALAREQLSRDIGNAYAAYKNSLQQLGKEERNVNTSRRNLQRAQEAFNLGQITSTQLREAQLNVSRTQFRLNTTKYAAKTAEVELLRLSGRLMQRGD